MNFLAALHGPESVATVGWLVGVLAGAVFDVGLLFAIGSTPRLREYGDAPPTKPRSRILLRIPAMLIIALGLAGFFFGGRSALLCYVVNAAMAAAVVVSGIMLLLIATAANHIARRSVW
jgi:hypothetical protein